MLDLDPYTLTFAQDGAAGLPGEIPATPDGTTAAPGGAGGTQPGSGSSPFGSQFLLIMLGLFVVMIIFSSMGPRREKKRRVAMLSAIKKHDKVQTVGGVVGAIVEIKPDYVVLKVDESSNTRITFSRSAIQQVLKSSDEPLAATSI